MNLLRANRFGLVLIALAILHGVGLWWGLPASDGWDNDGVAPRDFLPGLAATFTPGRFYTYPPVHLAILAVLTLPITIVGAIKAPSFAVADIVGELIKVPYMTSIALVARSVALVMSLGIALNLALVAEEIRAQQLAVELDDPRVRRAGVLTLLVVGLNASCTYYAHTSNLDVPYMFWASWSLLWLVRAVIRDDPKLLRKALAFAVLAIGTKDQAYAMFLLSVPVVLIAMRKHRRDVLIAVALAIGLMLVVDAAIFNPTGFRARVAFLTGSASQDYVEYTKTLTGRLTILLDAAKRFHFQYPAIMAVFAVLGIRSRKLPALLPLLFAVSFTIAFNFVARRTDPRFLLPQGLLIGLYAGLGIDRIVGHVAGQITAAVGCAMATFTCICVDANLLNDPRYDAERWLAEHAKPGDTIETYGLNVYLTKMPSQATVNRVGPEPLNQRNPIPGITEVQAPFEQAPDRQARFIVVSTGWAWRYLLHHPKLAEGHQLPPTIARSVTDDPSTKWFEALVEDRTPFKFVHGSHYESKLFPPVDVHGTIGRSIFIYERAP